MKWNCLKTCLQSRDRREEAQTSSASRSGKQGFILLHVIGLALFLITFALSSAYGGTASYKVLVFSKTAAFRHDSIPDGIAALRTLGTKNNFAVDTTEDAAAISDANLVQYKAVVFLSTTGDILDASQQSAFEGYIRGGGGFVGIHSTSDTEYSWPWYGALVGAYFAGHPSIQSATIKVADQIHPSTESLPKRWVRTDEWYDFQSNPRGRVHVLATLDEQTYSGGMMGFDHPIAWCHEYDGGRAWYTGGGHTKESYSEPLFLTHLLGGIEFAAGVKPADSGATIDSNYQKVALDRSPVDPMELAVAPDGRVFYIERGGRLKIYRPQQSSTVVAGQLSVFRQLEDGLLGLALDPGFAVNQWLYLFYSPAGATPVQHLSRFKMEGGTLDLNSERVLLRIPTQRNECCHSGGSLAFGPAGDLFISTGDNTNPFASNGYSPIDRRPGRSDWDAEKSSANANDLRGKILRIHPQADGTYTIPAGNLFPTDGSAGRPEIYVMGARNPFRISVDAATGWLYWGEVGPDADFADPARGPMGQDEWNQARSAGNYGWPYFVGNNKPYLDYDFAAAISGSAFNPNAPVNLSPNNTGPPQLPPARPAWIWYPHSGLSVEFPEINGGTGNTAMGGPVYHFQTNLISSRKLPRYYDNTVFIYEWSRNYIKEVKLDDDGNVLKINPFLPTFSFARPMDMEIGPDGAIYMIEWGTGFDGGNTNAQIIRIDYVGSQHAPVAQLSATPSAGSAPLTVQFSAAGSFDPDPNDLVTLAWSFRGDGTTDATGLNPVFTYTQPGNYTARLTVTDPQGNQGLASVTVTVGNNRPIVTIHDPPNGAFFDWGKPVHFQVSVEDVEDGNSENSTIPCPRIIVEPSLGHNDHAHSLGQLNRCEGEFVVPVNTDSDTDNLSFVLNATYVDAGAGLVAPLTGRSTHVLQPRHKQAEFFTASSGVITQATGDPNGGGQDIAAIDHGDHIAFSPINLTNISQVTFRAAASGPGGRIEVHANTSSGPLLGSIDVPVTGGAYTNLTASLSDTAGTQALFFVFFRNPGDTDLFVLNWLEFQGEGVSINPAPVYLQSAGAVTGVFADENRAIIDSAAKTIAIHANAAPRFYRLRSTVPTRIVHVQIRGVTVVLTYE
jgi:cytochrome c